MNPIQRDFNPDQRLHILQQWVWRTLDPSALLVPLENDASDRRYFRTSFQDTSYVIMDAPPRLENAQRFHSLSKVLLQQGLTVPTVFKADIDKGFLLITDFGDTRLDRVLTTKNTDRIVGLAMDNLITLQQLNLDSTTLPAYSQSQLQAEWLRFFEHYLPLSQYPSLSQLEQDQCNQAQALIIESALEQPQRLTHRDYHCKNLFLLNNTTIGTIDFQDLLIGPMTYDAMSLFYDHYQRWDRSRIQHWCQQYQEKLITSELIQPSDRAHVLRWIDWLAVLRILKNIGHFVALDRKIGEFRYRQYIPSMLEHLFTICQHYPALHDFAKLLGKIQPRTTP